MRFKVSASHIAADWALVDAIFAFNCETDFRLGGNERHGFHASAPRFGCGKSASTPERAIRSLLLDNGCADIRVEPVEI